MKKNPTINLSRITLASPTRAIPGVGSSVEKKLHRLGINTLGGLIYHLPARYEDFTNVVPIAEVTAKAQVTVQGMLASVKQRPTRRRNLTIIEALLKDDTGALRVVWFNQPFLLDTLEKGKSFSMAGQVMLKRGGLVLINPTYEKMAGAMVQTGRLLPVYPETAGLTSRWFRAKLYTLRPFIENIADPIPIALRREEGLMSQAEALEALHFPRSMARVRAAKERLAFEALLLLQLRVRQARRALVGETATPLPFTEVAIKEFVRSLPFKLTNGQRRAAWEILKDLEKPHPMNRLLEGDVGTGKTVVAAIAAYQAARHKGLTFFLVPTEILAQQHAQSLRGLFAGHGVSVGLLTHSRCEVEGKSVTRPELEEALSSHRVCVLVGTHALLQPKSQLPAPQFVIVDEQHRFGVRQRSQLLHGALRHHAHLLSMTATPIPRTLAMTIYGSLDISMLKEFPKGERKVVTKVVPPGQRAQAYGFIRTRIEKGEQAFVICPLVEESQHIDARAAVKEYERLRDTDCKGIAMGLIHGQLKSAEKEAAMAAFSKGETKVLVATSVVEVGIDVPNAAMLIIENAERFGLAQLHQLRGRVGRSSQQGYCFLFSEASSGAAFKRLRSFTKTTDGFHLAEEDLSIRGPGEFSGLRQSGLPDIAMAHLSDRALIQRAQQAAERLLDNDPKLERCPELAALVRDTFKDIVFA